MNKSLASLETISKSLLGFGFSGLLIGFTIMMASVASQTGGNEMGLGYLLLLAGAASMSLGVIGWFLTATAKAIIEGLGGSIKTKPEAK